MRKLNFKNHKHMNPELKKKKKTPKHIKTQININTFQKQQTKRVKHKKEEKHIQNNLHTSPNLM